MIERVTEYVNKDGETLRSLVEGDSVIINHVVMEAGQSFPAHITEHEVHIIIVRGLLSVSLEKQDAHIYVEGNMISFPRGTVSALSNPSGESTELFVVKSIVK